MSKLNRQVHATNRNSTLTTQIGHSLASGRARFQTAPFNRLRSWTSRGFKSFYHEFDRVTLRCEMGFDAPAAQKDSVRFELV